MSSSKQFQPPFKQQRMEQVPPPLSPEEMEMQAQELLQSQFQTEVNQRVQQHQMQGLTPPVHRTEERVDRNSLLEEKEVVNLQPNVQGGRQLQVPPSSTPGPEAKENVSRSRFQPPVTKAAAAANLPPAPVNRMNQPQANRSPTSQTHSSTEGVKRSSDLMTTRKPYERHPRSHRVYKLENVWKKTDASEYWPMTDGQGMNDVWFYLLAVEFLDKFNARVYFNQMVCGTHIKMRVKTFKVEMKDLQELLYGVQCFKWDLQGAEESKDMTSWLDDMCDEFLTTNGQSAGGGINSAELFDFVVRGRADPDVWNDPKKLMLWQPKVCGPTFAILVRKIARHSYKDSDPSVCESEKFDNPMQILGTFTHPTDKMVIDYAYEFGIFKLPEGCEEVWSL